MNLLQSAVETLLFYHPAVWWASSVVRTEREHCCDDDAIQVCDRLVYVTALSDLAAIRTPPRVVMAASGGSLLRRVRRILGGTSGVNQAGAGWLPAFVLMLLAGAFVPAALTSAPSAIQETRPSGIRSGVPGVVAGGGVGGVTGGVAGGKREGIVGGIAGGTLEGIVGAVAGGIPGGVVGGKQEGVLRGVAGGTAAGVEGGVSGTAAGGIGGVARRVSQNSGSASPDGQRQAREARRADLERARELQRRTPLARMTDLELQRRALESAGEEALRETEIAKLETALKLARERYERMKRLVEVGLQESQALAEIEVELRRIEQKIVAAQKGGQLREQRETIADLTAQLELARTRLERTNRLFAAGMIAESAVKEAGAAVTTSELKLAAVSKQLRETEADLELRQAERQAEIAQIERVLQEIGTSGQAERRKTAGQQAKQEAEHFDAALAEMEARRGAAAAFERDRRLLSSSAPVAVTDEKVRVGDLLVIEIAGEPDLPRVYVVADTGAVRLPLIGHVPVRDLTVVQVREAVLRELKKRGLADNPSVAISLRRPR